jgi:hypothetical protein
MKYLKERSSLFLNSVALLTCVATASFIAYAYIDKQNMLTVMRRRIPVLEKEVKAISEENRRLKYEIERKENPLHLMKLAREPEYGHLRYPYRNEVIIIHEGETGGQRQHR